MSSVDKVDAPQELRAKIVEHLNKFDKKKLQNNITRNDIKTLTQLKQDKDNTIIIMDNSNMNNRGDQ